MSPAPAVALVVRDLVVAGAATGALRTAGFDVRRLDSTLQPLAPAPADREGERAPAWVVLDLDARDADPLEVAARARTRWPATRVVGIVQHVHKDRITRARAAGLTVVPRSRLAQLGALLAG